MEDATRKVMKRVNPRFASFKKPVVSLSGGQRQAVAIARAIHFNARILIMDEPTAALGPAETAQVREQIKQLKTEGVGIFLISHDIHDVYDISDRISVMLQGKLVGTVKKSDVTTDEVLAMIIMGKLPADGAALDDGPRMTELAAASGAISLRSEHLEVELMPALGARLHSLRAFGQQLLRSPDDPGEHERDPFFWGGYVMAPWCNRLAAEPVSIGGRLVDLRSNFRDGTAIHGQVYARPWQRVAESSFEVSAGGDGWPWPYRARLAVDVGPRGLTVDLSLRNEADEPMPAGLGLHPWFGRPLELAVRAQSVFTSNIDSSPRPEPVAGAHDLRRLGSMAADLDATWAELGEPPVELSWPAAGLAGRMEASSNAAELFITAASPSDVDAVALEPQSHAPQGLRRLLAGEPGALDLLPPGGSLRLTTRLTFNQSTGESQA
jgi:galactose mutarotase-like enzyme